MQILRFDQPFRVTWRKSSGEKTTEFAPGVDYVVGAQQYQRMCADAASGFGAALRLSSAVEGRIVPFHAESRWAGERVLCYVGAGGYGDQIMAWPVARLLARGGCRVSVLADPGNAPCWENQPWLEEVVELPVRWGWFESFKAHALAPCVTNLDEHPHQTHPTTALIRRFGIDRMAGYGPKMLAETVREIGLPLSGADQAAGKGLLCGYTGRYGVLQPAASAESRSLPPEALAGILGQLCARHPDLLWFVAADQFVPPAYASAIHAAGRRGDGAVRPLINPPLRALWALVAGAAVVVAPDSMAMHVAGAAGVPCVALFGPMHAGYRVAFYPTVRAFQDFDLCTLSPCLTSRRELPPWCPAAQAGERHCRLLAGVTPSAVAARVGTALQPA